MLRMRPKERSDCSNIVKSLAIICGKWEDPSYSTKPRKRTGLRTPTDLSIVSSTTHHEPHLIVSKTVQYSGSTRPKTPESQTRAGAPAPSPKSSPKKRRRNMPPVAEASRALEHQDSLEAKPNPPVTLEVSRPETPTPVTRHVLESDTYQPLGRVDGLQIESPASTSDPLGTPQPQLPHDHEPVGQELETTAPRAAPPASIGHLSPLGERGNRSLQSEHRSSCWSCWGRSRARLRAICRRWLCGCVRP
jgi:hypothetical protein